MDKFVHNLDKEIKSKKGFALLLTLSILSIVIALSSVLVNYLVTTKHTMIDTKAMIQGDMLYSDLQGVLSSIKPKDKEDLYKMLYSTPLPFGLKDGRISLTLKCSPLNNGVNINWLVYNSKTMKTRAELVQKVLDGIFQKYNIQNPNGLEEMLISYMKVVDSKQKKEFLSLKEFENIIFRYMLQEDDSSVENIPWNKYFVFNHVSKSLGDNMIDANYLSAELISVIFDIDLEVVRSEWSEGASNLNLLLTNNDATLDKKIYSTKFYPYTECEVFYTYMDRRFKFTFDDIRDEVKNFEFYGKE
jgi:hypothetical protein